ncbi:hypothetical protein TNIN_30361 [Trichonephila inaurata madagascariensis]|uniref:Uncharacterized protein n=1 Tax=Trichonephila inaurata madagascariensis TaxID=2747483 RepID=A0A8X7CLV0_9ARAC|nr:hypothetical protein TNIN_30361 [Trichonephila inaurata madagascariensis]
MDSALGIHFTNKTKVPWMKFDRLQPLHINHQMDADSRLIGWRSINDDRSNVNYGPFPHGPLRAHFPLEEVRYFFLLSVLIITKGLRVGRDVH